MKDKQKILTYGQARELKWFCSSVVGIRQEMYDTSATIQKFEDKIKRLEKTCELIERFLEEKIEPHGSFVDPEKQVVFRTGLESNE